MPAWSSNRLYLAPLHPYKDERRMTYENDMRRLGVASPLAIDMLFYQGNKVICLVVGKVGGLINMFA